MLHQSCPIVKVAFIRLVVRDDARGYKGRPTGQAPQSPSLVFARHASGKAVPLDLSKA
jgi:hypothetical protein